jgi:hypothetical protein
VRDLPAAARHRDRVALIRRFFGMLHGVDSVTSAHPETRSSATRPAPAPARRGLFAVLLVALVARVAYLIEQPSFPYFHKPETDAWLYHQAAQRIAGGDLWLGHDALRMSPGYFYFLGLVYRLFGDGPLAPCTMSICASRLSFPAYWSCALSTI